MKLVVVGVCLAALGCGRVRFVDVPDGMAGSATDASDIDAVPCAHTYCASFDGVDLMNGWDAKDLQGAATMSVVNGQYQVVLTASTTDRAYLSKQLPAPTSSVVVHVRMGYASTNPGTAEVDLMPLNWNVLPGMCTSFGYYFVRDGTMPFNLQETYAGTGCGTNANHPTINLDNSGMHEFVETITLGPLNTAHVKVVMDTTMILVDMDTTHAIASSPLTLRLGAFSARNITTPWTITYDDLYVDVQ